MKMAAIPIYVGLHMKSSSKPRKLCLCGCVEVLRPSQTDGVMLSAVRLPNHTFT